MGFLVVLVFDWYQVTSSLSWYNYYSVGYSSLGFNYYGRTSYSTYARMLQASTTFATFSM